MKIQNDQIYINNCLKNQNTTKLNHYKVKIMSKYEGSRKPQP